MIFLSIRIFILRGSRPLNLPPWEGAPSPDSASLVSINGNLLFPLGHGLFPWVILYCITFLNQVLSFIQFTDLKKIKTLLNEKKLRNRKINVSEHSGGSRFLGQGRNPFLNLGTLIQIWNLICASEIGF